ncbi:hypothetical protein [Spirosoma terrae]|uniref:Uncharacterized protein n=1 Tax=Spirosoma terrae TaxID=1968276 RepID=A0A6L9LIN7_9BACT|nr:hypothetical protein [Spirosoma terrae]NDU99101.1 hypothetical protein [Spirosoma terrae]
MPCQPELAQRAKSLLVETIGLSTGTCHTLRYFHDATSVFAFCVHPTPTGVDGEERAFTHLPGWAENSPTGRASCHR